ncbi:hypothetical protein GQ600_27176 [Phytophthora cactorum]|nr:hypothetical protein GQ600_27176 [Phytophthora cactorum]
MDKGKTRTEEDEWLKGQQSQTPKQLWAHCNMLTNYQVWVTYRLATLQLNLYYVGKEHAQGCPLDDRCTDTNITTTHLVWRCKRVHIFWSKLLAHWLGKEVSEQLLLAHQDYMASRQAPPIGELFQRRMIEPYGQWTSEFADAARRLWWGMGYTLLWQIRNQVVHEGKHWSTHQQLEYMWGRCLRQLRAVAEREIIRPSQQVDDESTNDSEDSANEIAATDLIRASENGSDKEEDEEEKLEEILEAIVQASSQQ